MFFRGKWFREEHLRGRLAELAARAAERHRGKRTILCPACRQERDHYAQGVVELHGKLWLAYSSNVFETIRKTEEIARARNDQERILWIDDAPGAEKVYCTLPELARSIGRELEKSFHGEAIYHGSPEEPFRRVIWNSDEPRPRPHSQRANSAKTRRGLKRSTRSPRDRPGGSG